MLLTVPWANRLYFLNILVGYIFIVMLVSGFRRISRWLALNMSSCNIGLAWTYVVLHLL